MRLAPRCRMVEDHYAPPQPPEPAAAPSPAATPEPGAAPGRRDMLLVGLAVMAGATVVMALLMTRGVPASQVDAARGVATAPAAVPASHPVETDAGPQWNTANVGLWLGDRRRGVAFEVPAQRPVSAWMKTVHLLLVVRCTGGTLEAFVVTDTPAQLEAETDDHTVVLRFDTGAESRERWPDSREHDALFAPDSPAFARQMLGARRLEFTFTPHNAARVTARFNVTGLEPLLRPSSKVCGLP